MCSRTHVPHVDADVTRPECLMFWSVKCLESYIFAHQALSICQKHLMKDSIGTPVVSTLMNVGKARCWACLSSACNWWRGNKFAASLKSGASWSEYPVMETSVSALFNCVSKLSLDRWFHKFYEIKLQLFYLSDGGLWLPNSRLLRNQPKALVTTLHVYCRCTSTKIAYAETTWMVAFTGAI